MAANSWGSRLTQAAGRETVGPRPATCTPRTLARPLEGLVEIGGLDHGEPADLLLRFRIRTVCHRHLAAGRTHDRGRRGIGEGAEEDPHAGCLHLLLDDGDARHHRLGLLGRGRFRTLLLEDRQQVLRHQRSRPTAATGLVTVICGGAATSGMKPDIADCIASLWPWCCIDSSSAIKAKNQKLLFSPRWYE